jgi:hypothetical protein
MAPHNMTDTFPNADPDELSVPGLFKLTFMTLMNLAARFEGNAPPLPAVIIATTSEAAALKDICLSDSDVNSVKKQFVELETNPLTPQSDQITAKGSRIRSDPSRLWSDHVTLNDVRWGLTRAGLDCDGNTKFKVRHPSTGDIVWICGQDLPSFVLNVLLDALNTRYAIVLGGQDGIAVQWAEKLMMLSYKTGLLPDNLAVSSLTITPDTHPVTFTLHP